MVITSVYIYLIDVHVEGQQIENVHHEPKELKLEGELLPFELNQFFD